MALSASCGAMACSIPAFLVPLNPRPGPPRALHSRNPVSRKGHIGDLPMKPWVLRESTAFSRKHLDNMAMGMNTGGDETQAEEGKGALMLRSANLSLMRILVTGEVLVGVAAVVLAYIGNVNPFAGVFFSSSALVTGCLGAIPIFLVSVLLEKSGVDFFRKIDQDTKLYVVQVFGAERNFPVVLFWAFILAANAGFFEEILFRGVIQQWLGAHVGDLPSLGLTSVLFGLAHSPVPGASSFTEACYGANFGLLYMISGGNILVPIVAHVVYDLLTFLEVHQRATAQLENTMTGNLPQKQQEQQNVGKVVRKFNLSQNFVDMSYGVFKQLDLDQNGVIDQGELQLGLRTFGKFASDEETRQIMQQADLDKNNALSFDEWVHLLALNYSSLLSPKEGQKLGS